MLYMKVVGKTQDEVCGNILACLSELIFYLRMSQLARSV